MGAQKTERAGASLVSRVTRHLIEELRSGTYAEASCLPSERELAGRLKVSRNTVAAAYADLEQQGVIRRIHGKGAFFCSLVEEDNSFSWSGKISRFANALDEPVLELLARRCSDPIKFPLSTGTPSLEIFPKAVYAASLSRVLDNSVPAALAVAPTEGQWALREAIACWLGVPPLHVMITAGAQEGIDLLARCLIEPQDNVVVDSPTYPGALQSFLSAGARLLPWSTGWSLAQLEELLLRHRPKLIFTTPTFQNPTGKVMSLKIRMGLLTLANRYRVPVIEDDVYSRTYFGEQPTPSSLYQLDRRSCVIQVSTFSKVLAPGLRIGWLTAPLYMVKQLALIKMRSNLFTGGLNQLILADMLAKGEMSKHLERLRRYHCELRDLAIHALTPAVDKGLLQFEVPGGGLYLWCKLLGDLDTDALVEALETHGVSVAPGIAFEPERKERASRHFRLCFTAIPRSRLAAGMQVLVRVLEKANSTQVEQVDSSWQQPPAVKMEGVTQ